VFSTAADSQTAVTVHVLQGERKQAAQNKSLGQFNLEDIPPAPRGMPQIEVTFDIDANGILHVGAKDKATGKEQTIQVKANSGLSDEEVDQMVKDAEAHADEDKKFEQLVSARNQADHLVHATKKTLEEAADKATDEEKAAITTAITDLEEALQGSDAEEIEAKTKALADASGALAQRMYAEAAQQEQGAEGATDADQASAAADDVVDAEFEEVKDDKK
jgi:molecular chaperone DnaK